MSNDSKANPQREAAQKQNENQEITEGDRFVAEDHDGSTITINKAVDDSYPEGSQYISRTSSAGEKDPTMIVGPEGDILNKAPEGSDDISGDGEADSGNGGGGEGGDGGE